MDAEQRTWDAHWLGALLTGGARTPVPATYFRREFQAPSDIRKAILHVTALGLYECEINGRVAGDHVLAPGWTDFTRRVYYQTHDVTGMLRSGQKNAVGLILGDGWFCGHIANNDRQLYGDKPQFLLQIDIHRTGGSILRIASDSAWMATTGPILEHDLIMGEAYDARLEPGDWSLPGYDQSAWQPAPADLFPQMVAGSFRRPAPKRRNSSGLGKHEITADRYPV